MHNDANVLCMGARVIGGSLACELVEVFLNTEFEGGRHQRRVDQITAIENGEILYENGKEVIFDENDNCGVYLGARLFLEEFEKGIKE